VRCGRAAAVLLSDVTTVVVAVSSLIAASVQATTGLGFALILTPVLFALLNPDGAIVAVTAFGLALNLLVLLAERRRPTVAWNEVLPILSAVVPGAVCGLVILRALSKPVLQVSMGCAVLAAAAMMASGRIRLQTERSWPRLVVGFTTGTLSTSTGIGGPPLALWLSSRGIRPGTIRDSITAVFIGTGIIAALTLIPVVHSAHLGASVVLGGIASVVAGHAIGSRLFKRLDSDRFELLLLTIIAATGLASVILGVTSL
jgi:uncharacterized protein